MRSSHPDSTTITNRGASPANHRSRSSAVVRTPAQKQTRGQSRGVKYIGACHSSIAHTNASLRSLVLGTCGTKRSIPPSSEKCQSAILAESSAPRLNRGQLRDERSIRLDFATSGNVRILRRMPRMQVYLPDDLYKLVKKARLPASELLQDAVRAEVRRRELLAEADRYIRHLSAEVGKPSARQRARASAITQRIVAKRHRKAG
jgi:hypothetical protein